MYAMSSKHASQRSSFFFPEVNISRNSRTVPAKRRYRSILKTGSKAIGRTRELTPRMKKILKMFDPIMLPTAMSLFFFTAATTDVASSGKEVPAATIVNPISFSLTPSAVAMSTADVTTNLPPMINPARPTTMRIHERPVES